VQKERKNKAKQGGGEKKNEINIFENKSPAICVDKL
jgi:hypothetical protein